MKTVEIVSKRTKGGPSKDKDKDVEETSPAAWVFCVEFFLLGNMERRILTRRIGATRPAWHVALASPARLTLASWTLDWGWKGRIKWRRVESVTSAAQTRARFIGFSSLTSGKKKKSPKAKLGQVTV